jgi:hypothetical protein
MILRNGKFSGKILRKIFHLTSLGALHSNASTMVVAGVSTTLSVNVT